MPMNFTQSRIEIFSKTIEFKINDRILLDYVITNCRNHNISYDLFFNGNGIRLMSDCPNVAFDNLTNYLEGQIKQDTVLDVQLQNNLLKSEVERLKNGKFSSEELQNLCHNLEPTDRKAFLIGCRKEQERLFGKIPLELVREIYETETKE